MDIYRNKFDGTICGFFGDIPAEIKDEFLRDHEKIDESQLSDDDFMFSSMIAEAVEAEIAEAEK